MSKPRIVKVMQLFIQMHNMLKSIEQLHHHGAIRLDDPDVEWLTKLLHRTAPYVEEERQRQSTRMKQQAALRIERKNKEIP